MIKSHLIGLILLFFLTVQTSFAQCDQAFIDQCSTSGGSVKYIKHFRIRFVESSKQQGQSEGKFSVILNKGSHYRFYTCNDATKPGQTFVELISDFGNFGGNFNPDTGAEYKAFDFVCNKTGPYYLTMHFKDGKEGCGVCVLTLVVE